MVNRDPVAAAIAQLRSQLAAARAENASLKRRLGDVDGGGAGPVPGGGVGEERLQAALEEMQARVRGLERDNRRLKVELEGARSDAAHATQRMVAAQASAARLQQRLAAADPAAAEEEATAGGGEPGSGGDVVHSQLLRIAELEQEVSRCHLGHGSRVVAETQMRVEAAVQQVRAGQEAGREGWKGGEGCVQNKVQQLSSRDGVADEEHWSSGRGGRKRQKGVFMGQSWWPGGRISLKDAKAVGLPIPA